MNRIQCLIVEDEPIAQRILEGYIYDVSELVCVATCNNALEAREALHTHSIQLMFLDIEMPKIKGLSFLRTLVNPPAVIITTAHRDYALEGFELGVLDYLLKPISLERFLTAVNRFKKEHAFPIGKETLQKNQHVLLVKSDRKMMRIQLHQILYFEGMSNYVKIHLGEHTHVVYTSLTQTLKEVDDRFIRIHKSFIINENHITAFTGERVELGDIEVPIGKSFREEVLGKLKGGE